MKLFLSLSALLILLTGCINLPSMGGKKQIGQFDLKVEIKPEKFPFSVEIVNFTSDSPAKFKMLSRENNQVTVDEYNKWVQTPPLLLTRVMQSAFPGDGELRRGAVGFRVSGNILEFEREISRKEVVLTVKYVVFQGTSTVPLLIKTCAVSETLSNGSPEEFARAMSAAALQQVLFLRRELSSLYKLLRK